MKDDPFLSLSGASALRGYYTSGVILFRPDEERDERELHVELRNGPGLEPMLVDKIAAAAGSSSIGTASAWSGRTSAASSMPNAAARHDVILRLIAEEAARGRLCTTNAFASKFENKRGLGGKDTIRERIGVLANKGYIKFRRDAPRTRQPYTKSKNGYLVVQDMLLGTGEEAVDPETGEIIPATVRVLPSHFQCPRSEALPRGREPGGVGAARPRGAGVMACSRCVTH